MDESGLTLRMSNVGRHHSGEYECVAENGVGLAARARVNLNVLCE